MDRRETVTLFRQRLSEVLERTGESRAAFARRVGLDRSTLTQLLDEEALRLPRAETIVAIASAAQVSVDWLLGLSQEGQLGPELVPRALEIEAGADAPADERLLAWHQEAAGYRIRYVPSGIPDLLKTEELIRYEYGSFDSPIWEGRIGQAMSRLAHMRRPDAELEMASSLETVEAFARGQMIWHGLDWPARRQQLEQMAQLTAELYPALRWFLYDGLKCFSVPYTLFGPQRAAVYFGNMYFVFNSTEHIRILAKHFDGLIRAAIVQPPDVPREIERMIRENEPRTAGGQRRLAQRADALPADREEGGKRRRGT